MEDWASYNNVITEWVWSPGILGENDIIRMDRDTPTGVSVLRREVRGKPREAVVTEARARKSFREEGVVRVGPVRGWDILGGGGLAWANINFLSFHHLRKLRKVKGTALQHFGKSLCDNYN